MINQTLVITSYPPKGSTHAAQTVGAASYTKNLITGLQKALPKTKLSVMAEVLTKPESYTETGIKVTRLWQRNNLSSIIALLKKVIAHPAQTILVSFEAYMFGSPLLTLFFLAGLSVAKARGKKVVFLLHQVPQNFDGLEQANFKKPFLMAAKSILLRAVSLSSNEVIVFENQLKNYFPNQNQVTVVPHLVPKARTLNKAVARRKLGWKQNQTYILYFGYLAPYKGIDWLVKNWPTSSTTQLVVAGGINPNHAQNQAVLRLVANIEKNAAKKDILTTGFVKESDIELYFSACDALILPYQNFMSSSGPLSLAVAYQQPVLLSQPLAAYGASPDFAAALTAASLSLKDVTFNFNTRSLQTQLINFKRLRKQFAVFSKTLSTSRSTVAVGRQLAKVLQSN